ncbi:hypothetical protein Dsin_007441 [Dipteronia sinensis]|uniref:Uncharacterized protein n=1 Tax=Dipteronia sinensis TaxID=43782 RepID=A0AAE0B1I6_9ROSI|nr:hypothetical protein Dsin_007441 [Dipteronia sinensis]
MSGMLAVTGGLHRCRDLLHHPSRRRLACVSTIFRSACRFQYHVGTASCVRSHTLDPSPVHRRRSSTSAAVTISFTMANWFPEVLVRFGVIPFEFGGKISTSLLSPMTTYMAYLVFAEDLIFCRDNALAKVAVGLDGSNDGLNRTIYLHRVHLDGDDDGLFPKKRIDGWLESELGEFFNRGDEEGELSMTMKTCWKENLLIQGIEIRPKKE